MATPDGSLNSTQINQLQVSGGAYAGGTSNSYGFGASRFGSADIPTMSFFRNRVYDQESGRFTQEDPIGVGGGLNLYQYAANNPVAYTDPFGLCVDEGGQGQGDSTKTKKNVTANYCSTRGTLQLSDSTGKVVFETPAGNNTVNPSGDPNQVGSNGPAPTGTFPVQPVIVMPADATATGPYGPAFFPVGSCGTSPTCSGSQAGDIARQRGIGIHGGRTGPQYPTRGCIRVSNQAVGQMASGFNITSITIGCQ